MCEAKISNRLPCPAEPVSEFSVVKPPWPVALNTEHAEARGHGGNERLVDADYHSKSNVRMLEWSNVGMLE